MTINDHIEVDRYKSKMGTDEDVCVVNFQVENKEAGDDLVDFLETGYEWILDAAVSPGTNSRGKHQVFVEIERNVDLLDNLSYMLKEVSNIGEIETWRMRYGKNPVSKLVDETSLQQIPNTAEGYSSFLADSALIDDIKKAIHVQ